MSAKKKQIPILPMNNYALKALFEENRRLREQLDQEKSTLSDDIAHLKNHIVLSDKLAKANRISPELVDLFMTVSSSLDSIELNPNLTFHQTQSKQISDSSIQVKKAQDECEKMDSIYRDTVQKRATLALEEQKLNTKRSNLLQSISAGRQQLDELVSKKEKLEHEIEQLKDLKDFWEKRNDDVKNVLQSAETEISSISNMNETKSIELLSRLKGYYSALEDASRIVNEKV
ncbi:hypothetical protein M9Y10_043835 [Tritrichomonas musculus]|uniref:Uncharacterized protein n=1 Tax=Tritrichomonas musculus TaxID=1915356 RepID=A0ABR2K169_9EUKA